jgi:hypothetical protein
MAPARWLRVVKRLWRQRDEARADVAAYERALDGLRPAIGNLRRSREWVASKLRDLRAQRRWIPVVDRLPEDDGIFGDPVLVSCVDNYGAGRGRQTTIDIHNYHPDGSCWESSLCPDATSDPPTHWMPLPDPPEGT